MLFSQVLLRRGSCGVLIAVASTLAAAGCREAESTATPIAASESAATSPVASELAATPPSQPVPTVVAKPVITTFGERQLAQLLDDRPDMRGVIDASHPVYSWVIEAFNGDHFGQRVYWNGNSPQSGRPAEHASPYHGYPPYVSITGGSDATPVDKWTMVVFELHNLGNADGFEKLMHEALDGSIDGEGYANGCVKLEFEALERTREFFVENPLPKSPHGRDTYYNWITDDLGTFDEYQERFDRPGMTRYNSNFEYFRAYYDSTLVPYRQMNKQSSSKNWFDAMLEQ